MPNTAGGATGNDDIFKELEEYVNEKKQTNKYLDDISDIETGSTNAVVLKNNIKTTRKECQRSTRK